METHGTAVITDASLGREACVPHDVTVSRSVGDKLSRKTAAPRYRVLTANAEGAN